MLTNTRALIFVLFGSLFITTASVIGAPPPASHDADFQSMLDFADLVRRNTSNLPTLSPAERAQRLAGASTTIDAGRGPIPVRVPAGYDGTTAAPLIMLLHGYMNTGLDIENWFQFSALADEFGFFLLAPTGNTDIVGNPFWNATNACCDNFGANPDDSSYLRAVLDEMRVQFNINDRRIYLAGFSNGGFMSYRMACDHADLIAAIASLAGATYLNPNSCTPSEPVSVLQIHGTSDTVIRYPGGCILLIARCYPSANESVELWADYNQCDPVLTSDLPPVDVTSDTPGAESSVIRYETNCSNDAITELWTIPGAPHDPNLSSTFNRSVVEWLFAHPKPCVADLAGNDELIDVNDLLALFAQWGACAAPCAADLAAPFGTVDVNDLLALFAQWGTCS